MSRLLLVKAEEGAVEALHATECGLTGGGQAVRGGKRNVFGLSAN